MKRDIGTCTSVYDVNLDLSNEEVHHSINHQLAHSSVFGSWSYGETSPGQPSPLLSPRVYNKQMKQQIIIHDDSINHY